MRKLILKLAMVLMCCVMLGCAKPPSSEEMASWDYGPYPENYEQIVKNYMAQSLFDPYSAQFIFDGSPSQRYLAKPFGGETLYGWGGTVSVNAKNRFGAYVGYHTFAYIIKYGSVICLEENFRSN
nr:MAG TPA: protein of unknown function (DUF4969) [Caudoviricetes sp.]